MRLLKLTIFLTIYLVCSELKSSTCDLNLITSLAGSINSPQTIKTTVAALIVSNNQR